MRSSNQCPYRGRVLTSIRKNVLITKEGIYILGVALATGLAGSLLGRYELITMAALLSSILTLDAAILAYRSYGVRASLRIVSYPERVVLGSSGLVVAEAWVEGRREIPLRLEDSLPKEVVVNKSYAEGTGFVRLEYVVKPLYRGTYVLGPLRLLTPSPLNTAVVEYAFPPATERRFDVVPTFYAEVGRGVKPRVRYPSPGAHEVMLKGGTGDFIELREYVVGDDVRLIHWPSTARSVKGVPLVRELLSESLRKVFIVIDPYIHTTFEYSLGKRIIDDIVNAAGGVAYLAMGYGDPVGFYIAGSPSLSLPPTTRRDYIHAALKHLETLQPVPEPRLRWVIEVAGRYVGKGTLVLILSTLHVFRPEDTLEATTSLRALGLTPVYVIPDTLRYAELRIPEDVKELIREYVKGERRRIDEHVDAIVRGGGSATLAPPGRVREAAVEAYVSMRGLIHAGKA